MASSTPTVRSRQSPQHDSKAPSSSSISPLQKNPAPPSQPNAHTPTTSEDATHITLLDILRLIAGLLLLSSTLSYFITGTSITWNHRPPFTRPARIKAWLRGPLNLTDAQLSAYNGTDPALPILLALNGSIYDVSASPHLYGPGGSYAFFAGRDATRAFVTGCFDTDLNGDLRGVEEMFVSIDLTDGEVVGREGKLRREREGRLARRRVEETVRGWERMFDGGREGKYFWVGRVWRGEGSGWEGWGEVKELCLKAREGRPRRTAEEVR